MFSGKTLYKASQTTSYARQIRPKVLFVGSDLIKSLITCSYLIYQLRQRIKVIDLAKAVDEDLISILKKLINHIPRLADTYAYAKKRVTPFLG